MKKSMRVAALAAGLSFVLLAVSVKAAVNWRDLLGIKKSESAPTLEGLTEEQIAAGLKEALAKGVQHAITNLGRPGGFLNDAQVRIPMPESLKKVEKTLRALGQDGLADEFVTSMNQAAEKAVPEAMGVLGEGLRRMTLVDAKTILTNTNNDATEYFRRTSETNLHARFLPIVQQATERVGVTRAYKQMVEKANLGGLGAGLSALGVSVPSKESLDVDAYVTGKALDGLFLKIGEQERLIRQNPAARTTELLQQVFGVLGKSGAK